MSARSKTPGFVTPRPLICCRVALRAECDPDLGRHELGHYFAARYHRVNVTLPYFIRCRLVFLARWARLSSSASRCATAKSCLMSVLPAAGRADRRRADLVVRAGNVKCRAAAQEAYVLEGNSLLYAGPSSSCSENFCPTARKCVYQPVGKAGWTGLLVTGLNLIPLGQLDGGHVVFTLFGKQARRLYIPILGLFIFLSLFSSMWLIWTLLLFFLGRLYAVPLDMITPLDGGGGGLVRGHPDLRVSLCADSTPGHRTLMVKRAPKTSRKATSTRPEKQQRRVLPVIAV